METTKNMLVFTRNNELPALFVKHDNRWLKVHVVANFMAIHYSGTAIYAGFTVSAADPRLKGNRRIEVTGETVFSENPND